MTASVVFDQNRHPSLDFTKFLMSLLVIAIHTNPLLSISDAANFYLVEGLGRLAVPFFLVCSGYFLGGRLNYQKDRLENGAQAGRYLLRRSKKMAFLYAKWTLVYLCVLMRDWIVQQRFSPMRFVYFANNALFFGSYFHLWYLLSLIYAFLILILLLPRIHFSGILPLAAALYAVEVAEDGYRTWVSPSLEGIWQVYDRFGCMAHALFRCLPFLLLGIVLAKKHGIGLNRKGFILSLAGLAAELILRRRIGASGFSFMVCMLPALYFLFQLVLAWKLRLPESAARGLARASLLVYCLHPLIIVILYERGMHDARLFFWTAALSLAAAFVREWLTRRRGVYQSKK